MHSSFSKKETFLSRFGLFTLSLVLISCAMGTLLIKSPDERAAPYINAAQHYAKFPHTDKGALLEQAQDIIHHALVLSPYNPHAWEVYTSLQKARYDGVATAAPVTQILKAGTELSEFQISGAQNAPQAGFNLAYQNDKILMESIFKD